MNSTIQNARTIVFAMLAISVAFLLALVTPCFAPARNNSAASRPKPPLASPTAQHGRPNLAFIHSAAPLAPQVPLRRETGSDTEYAQLVTENRRLRETNAILQDRLRALLQWIIANFRGRFPVPESLLSHMDVPAVTEDDLLNPQVSELLRLSPDEQERLNDALAYAVECLSDIESAILTVSEPRVGKIILHIPTFQDNGRLLKEDLFAALESTLGQDRFERFLKVAGNGLNQRFYHFGEASRTMVFELIYTGNESTPRLLIKDGYVLEIGPDIRQVSAVETVVTNLPQKYSAYVAWLPDYMVRSTENR